MQTCWKTTTNVWPLCLPTKVSPPSIKSYCSMDQILISCENMIIYTICTMLLFWVFGDILSLNVKMYLWLKLYTVAFFVSGQTKLARDQIIIAPTVLLLFLLIVLLLLLLLLILLFCFLDRVCWGTLSNGTMNLLQWLTWYGIIDVTAFCCDWIFADLGFFSNLRVYTVRAKSKGSGRLCTCTCLYTVCTQTDGYPYRATLLMERDESHSLI